MKRFLIAALLSFVLLLGFAWFGVHRELRKVTAKIEKKVGKEVVFTEPELHFFPPGVFVYDISSRSRSVVFRRCFVPFSWTFITSTPLVSIQCESGSISQPHQKIAARKSNSGKAELPVSVKLLSTVKIPKDVAVELSVTRLSVALPGAVKTFPLHADMYRSTIRADWGKDDVFTKILFVPKERKISVDMSNIPLVLQYTAVTFKASVGGWCGGSFDSDTGSLSCDIFLKNIMLSHPTIDKIPQHLPFLRIQGSGVCDRIKKACDIKKGRLSIGSLDSSFSVHTRGTTYDLMLSSGNLPLTELATLVSDPQLSGYRVDGELLLSVELMGEFFPAFSVDNVDIDGRVELPGQDRLLRQELKKLQKVAPSLVADEEPQRLDWMKKPFIYKPVLADGSERKIPVNTVQPGGFLLVDLLPKYVIWSIILAEDSSFYLHHGVDFAEINQAVFEAKDKKRMRGGSTITQQLAKNLLLTRDRTIVRKFKELLLAIEIDSTLSKRQQLNVYLSIVEWAPGVYGIEHASEFYFDKPAESLSVLESAYLASIISCPTKCSAHFYRRHVPDGWMKRVSRIVSLLYEHDKITTKQYVEAMKSDIVFKPIYNDDTAP